MAADRGLGLLQAANTDEFVEAYFNVIACVGAGFGTIPGYRVTVRPGAAGAGDRGGGWRGAVKETPKSKQTSKTKTRSAVRGNAILGLGGFV